jgi:hypothetical protein
VSTADVWNDPVPSFHRTDTSGAELVVTARSSAPSPLRSAAVMSKGASIRLTLWAPAKAPVPSFFSTDTRLGEVPKTITSGSPSPSTSPIVVPLLLVAVG